MDNVLNYKKAGQWYELGEDTPEGIAGASYDVSATDADKVKLYLLSNGDGTYTALLSGTGATKDYPAGVRPWDELAGAISSIVVGKGVTSIGERMFRRHEAVKSLIFEDSSKIKHLGSRAFQSCQFGGEFSFHNLEDEELTDAFLACTKLEGVTFNEKVKKIGEGAFVNCLSLQYVHGVSNVEGVGLEAFVTTPSMERLDLDPAACTEFEESAFFLSGAMRYANTTAWPNTQMASNAIPAKSFAAQTLSEIRSVGLPNVPPKEVNPDAQYKYTDIPYCKLNGSTISIGDGGCMAAVLYHMFNWYHGAPYDNIRDWWNVEIAAKYAQKHNGAKISDNSMNDILAAMVDTLGWTPAEGTPIIVKSNEVKAKQAIASALAAGRPLYADIRYSHNYDAGHAVAIIGSNAVTDKLIVVDSTRTSGDKGCIYEMSFEQLFGDFNDRSVVAYDVEGGGS